MAASENSQRLGEARQQQFFELKGYVESLLAQYGLAKDEYEFEPITAKPYLKGAAANLVLTKGSRAAFGLIGNLDQKVLRAYDIKAVVSHVELQLEFLPLRDRKFQPFSKFPSVTRDISVFVPMSATVKEIEKQIRSAAGKLFKQQELFDVFEKDGKRSLSFHLIFGSM